MHHLLKCHLHEQHPLLNRSRSARFVIDELRFNSPDQAMVPKTEGPNNKIEVNKSEGLAPDTLARKSGASCLKSCLIGSNSDKQGDLGSYALKNGRIRT